MDEVRKALRITQKLLSNRWQQLVGSQDESTAQRERAEEQHLVAEQQEKLERAARQLESKERVANRRSIIGHGTHARLARISQTLDLTKFKEPDPWAQAIDLCSTLHELAHSLIVSSAIPNYESIELTEPKRILEPNQVLKADIGAISVKPQAYCRWRATTAERSLCVRARPRLIEFFVVPDEEYNLLSYAEFGSRFRGKIELIDTAQGQTWLLNKKPLLPDEAIALVKALLESLSENSPVTSAPQKRIEPPPPVPTNIAEIEKQNLIYRLLNQEEQFKRRIARDLHDTVLADLMTLKRSFIDNEAKKIDTGELIDVLNTTIQKLRDVCNEYGPQHLRDWGMETSLQDMIDRLEERTGMDCRMACEIDIPDLPDMVETNLFRILQECLNNVEKYSRAQRVDVVIEQQGNILRFSVTDDGVGFSKEARPTINPSGGGMGMESMKQRTELIRCFFPATISIQSEPGKGTRTVLEITLPDASIL